MDKDYGYLSSLIDKSETSPIAHLKKLNEKYKNFSPSEKSKAIDKHIDRGNSVTNALKNCWELNVKYVVGMGSKEKEKKIILRHIILHKSSWVRKTHFVQIILFCYVQTVTGKFTMDQT